MGPNPLEVLLSHWKYAPPDGWVGSERRDGGQAAMPAWGVRKILTAVLVNAAALAVAAWIFAGIRVGGDTTSDRVMTLLVVAIIFGLINAVVAPVVKTLSLPFIILTLGLLLLVINALMLLLAAEMADALDVAFRVNGFWTAVGGALVISIVSWALELAVDR